MSQSRADRKPVWLDMSAFIMLHSLHNASNDLNMFVNEATGRQTYEHFLKKITKAAARKPRKPQAV